MPFRPGDFYLSFSAIMCEFGSRYPFFKKGQKWDATSSNPLRRKTLAVHLFCQGYTKNKPTLDAVSAKLTASVVSGFFIPPFFNSGKKDVNDHFHPSYWIRTRRTAHWKRAPRLVPFFNWPEHPSPPEYNTRNFSAGFVDYVRHKFSAFFASKKGARIFLPKIPT